MPRRSATHRNRLDPKQVAALTALLRGASIEAAATEAGVHRATLHRWRTEAGPFRAALFTAQAEAVNRAARYLAQLAPSAVYALGGLLATEQPARDADGRPVVDRKGRPVMVPTETDAGTRLRAALGVLKELREYALVAPLVEAELPAGDTAPYPSKPLPYQEAEHVLLTLASGRGLVRRPADDGGSDADDPVPSNGHNDFPWEQGR